MAQVLKKPEYSGSLVDCSPILAFTTFDETRHTGSALSRWKQTVLRTWQLEGDVGLATEDGASNNKKANQLAGQEYMLAHHTT